MFLCISRVAAVGTFEKQHTNTHKLLLLVLVMQIVSMARRHSFAAKLTGAGGGGCAFVLLPPSVTAAAKDAFFHELREDALKYWETSLGGQGVCVEHSA